MHVTLDTGVMNQYKRLLESEIERAKSLQSLVEQLDKFMYTFAELNDHLQEIPTNLSSSTKSSLSSGKKTISFVFFVSLIVGIAVAAKVISGVRNPIKELVMRLDFLAHSDLRDLHQKSTSGGFGETSESLEKLIKNLTYIVVNLKSQSQQLLTLAEGTNK